MNDEIQNPYYSPKLLGLDMISFDEPDLSYEYNTCAFWKTPDGRVFMAIDSGCSCPTPFEDYSGRDMDEAIQKMTQIAGVEDAIGQLRTWAKPSWRERPSFIDDRDISHLRAWYPNDRAEHPQTVPTIG